MEESPVRRIRRSASMSLHHHDGAAEPSFDGDQSREVQAGSDGPALLIGSIPRGGERPRGAHATEQGPHAAAIDGEHRQLGRAVIAEGPAEGRAANEWIRQRRGETGRERHRRRVRRQLHGPVRPVACIDARDPDPRIASGAGAERDHGNDAVPRQPGAVASEHGAASVAVDDVVRGWIRTTPPEQRNGLVAVIESLGLEPELYADELESGEGWEEEPEDSGM